MKEVQDRGGGRGRLKSQKRGQSKNIKDVTCWNYKEVYFSEGNPKGLYFYSSTLYQFN